MFKLKSKKIKKDYIYLAVIFLLMISNLFYFVKFNNPNIINHKNNLRYPLIDFARNFIPQEHYLSNLQPLRNSLNELVNREQAQGKQVSIYFEFLNTGGNISLNQDLHLIPASLNKLPVALAILNKVEQGEWLMTDRLVLLPEDVDPLFGSLFEEAVGSSFTIEFLLTEMLQKSDNTALNILLRNIGIKEVMSVLDEIGLKELFDQRGTITAKEFSRIFRSLYNASLLNRENSQLMLSWLTQTNFNNFITKNIPTDILVAHKFGLNQEFLVFADSGIVYLPNRPYLLTVLVNLTNSINADVAQLEAGEIMSEVSDIIYKFINEQ